MRIFSAFLLLTGTAILLGCQPPIAGGDSWQDVSQVQADVVKMHEATAESDVDTIMHYTHPKIKEMAGGEDAIRSILEAFMPEVDSAKVEFTGEPDFLESEDSHFVVVPTKATIVIGGQEVVTKGFQFGQKDKNDSDWKYIEGNRVDQNLAQDWFPGFPSDYQFPKVDAPGL